MKVLLAGGTGVVGARLAAVLETDGHEIAIATRANGVDLMTGAGLDAAIAGADVVVDTLNAPAMDAEGATRFFRTTTETLLLAERERGVRHHVALSIVGVDRAAANGYYLGKVAQEAAILAGGVPFTILRATQFFEFLPTIADWLTVDGEVRAPRTLLQPVAVRDVVQELAVATASAPLLGTADLAGPERQPLDVLLARVLEAAGDARTVVRETSGQGLGADAVDSLVPAGVHRTGAGTLEEYLAAR